MAGVEVLFRKLGEAKDPRSRAKLKSKLGKALEAETLGFSSLAEQERLVERLNLAGHLAYADYVEQLIVGEAPRAAEWEVAVAGAGAADEPEEYDYLQRLVDGYRFVNGIERDEQMTSSYFLFRGEEARRTVARLIYVSTGKGDASGFLVGPNLLMTNHHVIKTKSQAKKLKAQFDYVKAPEGEEKIPTFEHRLDPDKFFYTHVALDFTIVYVDEEAEGSGGTLLDRFWNPLLKKSGKALLKERVNIIQHPGGAPQYLALRDNRVVALEGPFLHYKTDTEKGSSGAPVMNDQWNLAALHRGEVPRPEKRKYKKPITLKDGRTWDPQAGKRGTKYEAANEGVRISEIVHVLEELDKQFVGDQRPKHLTGSRELLKAILKPPPPRSARRMMDLFTKLFQGMLKDDADTVGDPDGPGEDSGRPRPPVSTKEDLSRAAAAWNGLDVSSGT